MVAADIGHIRRGVRRPVTQVQRRHYNVVAVVVGGRRSIDRKQSPDEDERAARTGSRDHLNGTRGEGLDLGVGQRDAGLIDRHRRERRLTRCSLRGACRDDR